MADTSLEEGSKGAALLRWGTAAALVLIVHVAGAWAILEQMPDQPPAGAPQAPILIDLAPPAASPEVASLEAETGPEITEAPAETAPAEPPPEEPAVEPEPEPLPTSTEPIPPEVVEPAPKPEPIEQDTPPEPELAEEIPEAVPLPDVTPPEPPAETQAPVVANVPIPTARPDPPPVRQAAREEPEPHRQAERQEEEAEPRRQTAARQAPPPSAASRGERQRQASQGAQVSRAAQARWQAAVQARLNRYKRTPRGGGSGTAQISFVMSGNGRVVSIRLVRSAGSAALDQAALSLVQRASPFPSPPSGQQVSLTVPVQFE